jgi:hypothetical protein
MAGNYIFSVPKNPFTGIEYKDADVAGRIVYSYDDATGKYTLAGYNRSGSRRILELTNL